MTMRLYWVITEDHHEDWFIVARSYEEAEVFHEQNEGYLPGDAMAEEIIAIPDEIVTDTGWPSEQVLLAVGAKVINQGATRIVQLGNRQFCEGMLEETIRSLDDDRFEADGQGRLNETERTSKKPN